MAEEAAHRTMALDALATPLRWILDEELARGNEVREVSDWPPTCRLLVILARPFARAYEVGDDVTFRELDDPHYWKAEYGYGGGVHCLACGFGPRGHDAHGLGSHVARRVEELFAEQDVAEALRMLAACSDERGLAAELVRQGSDRIFCAMIRVSGGDLERLREHAIPLARRDFRDLLVAAGFADDVRAHASWTPRRFDAQVVEAWIARHPLDRVTFGPGDPVELKEQPGDRRSGTVIALLGLEPEPRYRVRLSATETCEASQWSLSRRG